MHVPDGFLDAPTSIATGVVAAAAVGCGPAGRAARARRPYGAAGRARRGVRLRHPDAQLPGRLGHQRTPARRCARGDPGRPLHGAAVHGDGLPGAVPALRRRRHHRARHQHRPDGVVTVVVGWTVFKTLQAVLPKRLSMVAPSAGIAALVSVPVAALGFVLLYAVGGTADLSLDRLATAMVGRARADRHRRGGDHLPGRRQHRRGPPRPRVRRPPGARQARARSSAPPIRAGRGDSRRSGTKVAAAVLLLVALVLAGVVSRFASGDPDGLTKVSEDHGFADTETDARQRAWVATAA